MINKGKICIIIIFFTIINISCKTENHIDKYEVSVDSLHILPDAFYSYRHGRVYFEDLKLEKYRIWYNLDNRGELKNIFEIEDFNDKNSNAKSTISKYRIDTTSNNVTLQNFISLSRKYKFGHIYIDRSNKISFSYTEDVREEYVKTFNDSLNELYLNNKKFKLLSNGWFEYIE